MVPKEFALVFVTSTARLARRKADDLMKTLNIHGYEFKVIFRNPIEIVVNSHHVYIMSEHTYSSWCKGKTCILDGILCRDGYSIQ